MIPKIHRHSVELVQDLLKVAQDARSILRAEKEEEGQHHHNEFAAAGSQKCNGRVRHIQIFDVISRHGYMGQGTLSQAGKQKEQW